MSKNY